jgi:hypothetical protein
VHPIEHPPLGKLVLIWLLGGCRLCGCAQISDFDRAGEARQLQRVTMELVPYLFLQSAAALQSLAVVTRIDREKVTQFHVHAVRIAKTRAVGPTSDGVRIAVQLVDATTGANLWAERFDRPLRDIFAVQDGIVQKIVTTLDLEFKLGERGISTWGYEQPRGVR